MNNLVILLLTILLVMIGSMIYLSSSIKGPNNLVEGLTSNVSFENEQQFIDINVRGGYSPNETVAQANTSATLRMHTQGTFDCSLALVIPALNFNKTLEFKGTEEIEIPPQEKGSVISGSCTHGMYGFRILFE